ncbi:MAG TPA: N-6 DNA methylase [Pirellulales bacterium]|nr:N-6 DNA methylase [Pirellulales bacterium]
MKTNGRIQELLSIRCLNDIEYGHRVIWPLLDYLGVPGDARRPQFQIESPFTTGLLKLDYLIHVGDIPMVTIEGEPRAAQFNEGYRQARNYSRNFKPRQRDCAMREMTVPFLVVAAGERAEMHRAVARGLNIEYEPLLSDGKPAFLDWQELLGEAARIPVFGAPDPRLRRLAAEEIGFRISESQQVLKADAATQFFGDLYAAIDSGAALHDMDDKKIILFNQIVALARHGKTRKIETACRKAGLAARVVKKVTDALSWYERKIEANEFSGAAVARGYRNFLIQPGGRGAPSNFSGTTQHRPVLHRGRIRYREVARYFTPTEVIQQMVRLADPKSAERVIDMTCGSGGFLAECLDRVAQTEGDRKARDFLTKRLVGTDDDPFCVSCSREMLTLMYPDCAEDVHVYLHNCLYRRAPAGGEQKEDADAERHLAPGRYDVVIGNPPGNDEYSGSNRDEVVRRWEEWFGHHRGGLMDHHCFIRRAVELAKPDGGRICLLLPEGLLARDNRGIFDLRHQLLRDCELRAVISLPRVFKNNNAKMAVVYLARNPKWNRRRRVLMASVEMHWSDEDGDEHETDLVAALETLVDRYHSTVEPANSHLPPGEGMVDAPPATSDDE